MPPWEINFLGHTLSLSVLIPFAAPLGIILGGAAIWPFFERWVTGDKADHQINDRPRNVPTRTAIGVAVVVFYGVLWAEGANDVLAGQFHVPLYTVTWIARVLVIAGPAGAYVITRRICLALQRKDAETLEHGVETGIIRQSPDGEFTEVLRPVTDEERAVLSARSPPRALPAADANGVPSGAVAGLMGKLRVEARTRCSRNRRPLRTGIPRTVSEIPATARANCRQATATGRTGKPPPTWTGPLNYAGRAEAGQVNDEHSTSQRIRAGWRPLQEKGHPVQGGGARPGVTAVSCGASSGGRLRAALAERNAENDGAA